MTSNFIFQAQNDCGTDGTRKRKSSEIDSEQRSRRRTLDFSGSKSEEAHRSSPISSSQSIVMPLSTLNDCFNAATAALPAVPPLSQAQLPFTFGAQCSSCESLRQLNYFAPLSVYSSNLKGMIEFARCLGSIAMFPTYYRAERDASECRCLRQAKPSCVVGHMSQAARQAPSALHAAMAAAPLRTPSDSGIYAAAIAAATAAPSAQWRHTARGMPE